MRVLVPVTQTDLSCDVYQRFTKTTTMSWEMPAFNGRESCNAVHAH